MTKKLFSAPFIVFMICGTLIPACVIAYYGFTDRSGAFTWTNVVAMATGQHAKALGLSSIKMNSGAGHDAQVIGLKVPTGMIFVPSRKGISHSPDEFTCGDDLEKGAYVLRETIYRLAY